MIYEQTKKKQIDAIMWTGENVQEIKAFVPKDVARFETDRVTQLLQLMIVDYDRNLCYKSKWGDYVVHDLDEDRYLIINRHKFESEYTEYSILHLAIDDTNDEWEPYINIQFVTAKKDSSTSGVPGYKVKDSTGFIKFYTKDEFDKQFTHLQNYMGNHIKLKIEEK